MPVKVYNLSYIKDLPKVIETGLTETSLVGLIDHLEAEYKSDIKQILLAGDRLAERARVTVNGRQVRDLEADIPDNSQVMFSLMLPGG